MGKRVLEFIEYEQIVSNPTVGPYPKAAVFINKSKQISSTKEALDSGMTKHGHILVFSLNKCRKSPCCRPKSSWFVELMAEMGECREY